MKFLTSKQFFDLCEMFGCQSGKTTEAVKAALNILMNGEHRLVVYIGHNGVSCANARKIAEKLLQEADPILEIQILGSNHNSLEFIWIGGGPSYLRFANFETVPRSLCGMAISEIIFDVNPEILFSGAADDKSNFYEIVASIFPVISHTRIKTDYSKLHKFF